MDYNAESSTGGSHSGCKCHVSLTQMLHKMRYASICQAQMPFGKADLQFFPINHETQHLAKSAVFMTRETETGKKQQALYFRLGSVVLTRYHFTFSTCI